MIADVIKHLGRDGRANHEAAERPEPDGVNSLLAFSLFIIDDEIGNAYQIHPKISGDARHVGCSDLTIGKAGESRVLKPADKTQTK